MPTDAAPAAQLAGGVFEYLDETPRTYQFWDGTVITPQRGDVCPLPYDPGDRRWKPSKRKPTRQPDNAPVLAAPEPAVTPTEPAAAAETAPSDTATIAGVTK